MAAFLKLLLASDIETSSGPHTCPICNKLITASRVGDWLIRCDLYSGWVHSEQNTKRLSQHWKCSPCGDNPASSHFPHHPLVISSHSVTAAHTPTSTPAPFTFQKPTHTSLPNRHRNTSQNLNIPQNNRRNVNILQYKIDAFETSIMRSNTNIQYTCPSIQEITLRYTKCPIF